MYNHSKQQQQERERIRGWIIYFLYKNSPKPVEMEVLKRLLDKVNFPLSSLRLAREIEHLRSLRLIRVFPSEAGEVSEAEQERLIQRYAECESLSGMGVVLCVRLTAAGTNFQEGLDQTIGIHRVD